MFTGLLSDRSIEDNSVPPTSFVTHRGQYEWLYVPFGLKTASQTFQRLMYRVLREHEKYALAYIDDVCAYTEGSFEEHIYQLDNVLTAVGDVGLTLKLSKALFAQTELLFVGHIVGNGRILPNPDRLEAI